MGSGPASHDIAIGAICNAVTSRWKSKWRLTLNGMMATRVPMPSSTARIVSKEGPLKTESEHSRSRILQGTCLRATNTLVIVLIS